MLAMMKLLIPDGIHDADGYIKPWIYSHAVWDVKTMVDEDSEDYYEIQYKGTISLRLHEVFLVNNIRGCIYKNVPEILSILIFIQITLFVIGLLMVTLLRLMISMGNIEKVQPCSLIMLCMRMEMLWSSSLMVHILMMSYG